MERELYAHRSKPLPNRADSVGNRLQTGTQAFLYVPNAQEPNDSTESLNPWIFFVLSRSNVVREVTGDDSKHKRADEIG